MGWGRTALLVAGGITLLAAIVGPKQAQPPIPSTSVPAAFPPVSAPTYEAAPVARPPPRDQQDHTARSAASVPPAPAQTTHIPPPLRQPTGKSATSVPGPSQPPLQLQPVLREGTLYISGRDVAMRQAPRRDASVLDRLTRGMEVAELERRTNWVRIRHPITAREGWISANLLTRERPAREAETRRTGQPQSDQVRPPTGMTDAAIIQRLIEQSRANYPGNCACPDNVDRAGRRCGGRSAHSRPGGRAPLCYPRDVSREAVAEFRRAQAASR